MPNHPLTEAQRRNAGAWQRIQKMATPDYPIGKTTYVTPRYDNGLTIGKGTTRIDLSPDEVALLIETAQELTKPAKDTTP
jgi:hypothetical protein